MDQNGSEEKFRGGGGARAEGKFYFETKYYPLPERGGLGTWALWSNKNVEI